MHQQFAEREECGDLALSPAYEFLGPALQFHHRHLRDACCWPLGLARRPARGCRARLGVRSKTSKAEEEIKGNVASLMKTRSTPAGARDVRPRKEMSIPAWPIDLAGPSRGAPFRPEPRPLSRHLRLARPCQLFQAASARPASRRQPSPHATWTRPTRRRRPFRAVVLRRPLPCLSRPLHSFYRL